jgi:hypothetical protein
MSENIDQASSDLILICNTMKEPRRKTALVTFLGELSTQHAILLLGFSSRQVWSISINCITFDKLNGPKSSQKGE